MPAPRAPATRRPTSRTRTRTPASSSRRRPVGEEQFTPPKPRPRRRGGNVSRDVDPEDYYAEQRALDAERAYSELRLAILREGGLAPNADYKREDIPSDLRRRRGKPADEMAQILAGYGFHYEGDADLMADVHKRRDDLTYATQAAGGRIQVICMKIQRHADGRFKKVTRAGGG